MSAASIVSKRRHHPSMDRSDATLPTPIPLPDPTSPTSEYADLCRALVARKAAADAERILAMLGLEVTA